MNSAIPDNTNSGKSSLPVSGGGDACDREFTEDALSLHCLADSLFGLDRQLLWMWLMKMLRQGFHGQEEMIPMTVVMGV